MRSYSVRQLADSRLLYHVRQKTHEAGVFDGLPQLALVARAGAGALFGHYFGVGRNEFFQEFHVFVINQSHAVFADIAVLDFILDNFGLDHN